MAVAFDDLALGMGEEAELLGELAGGEEIRPGLVELLPEHDGVDMSAAGDLQESFVHGRALLSLSCRILVKRSFRVSQTYFQPFRK